MVHEQLLGRFSQKASVRFNGIETTTLEAFSHLVPVAVSLAVLYKLPPRWWISLYNRLALIDQARHGLLEPKLHRIIVVNVAVDEPQALRGSVASRQTEQRAEEIAFIDLEAGPFHNLPGVAKIIWRFA